MSKLYDRKRAQAVTANIKLAIKKATDLADSIIASNPESSQLDEIAKHVGFLSDTNNHQNSKGVNAALASLRRITAMTPEEMEKEGAGTGQNNFVTDRDDSGKPKVPERAEVPRLAGRKKKEAEPAAAPAPAPAPAPSPTPTANTGMGPLQYVSTEMILKIVGDMPKEEDFAQNKGKQDALIELTKLLQSRPAMPAEQTPATPGAPAAAPAPTPVAASKKEPFGGKQAPPFGKKDKEEKSEDKEKEATLAGWENPLRSLKQANVTNPMRLVSYLKSQGFTPLRTAFMIRRLGAVAVVNKYAAGANAWTPQDLENGNVLENGGRLPEVAKAHNMKDEKPAKLNRPETTSPSKFASEMSGSAAVKKAEGVAEKLKSIYLEVKAITDYNDTRAVREAVESVYKAYDMFGEAIKTLSKQQIAEEQEEEAAKAKKEKKTSSFKFGGLAVAAAE